MAKSGTFLVLLSMCLAPVQAGDLEHTFLAGNEAAMGRMMKGMTVSPSGDDDADFVNKMEPHHQGATDMAVLELRYGRNEQLRRIAQEIIVDQQQEIDAMRLALRRQLQPSAPAPTTPPAATREPRAGMTMPHQRFDSGEHP